MFRRKGIDFIAEKYNQRFTVIVEIGSFGLVLPGSKDPHYPYSIETQRRNGGRERERKGWRYSTVNWRNSGVKLPHSSTQCWPLRLGFIGFLNVDILDKSGRGECAMKLIVPKFLTTVPNWSSLNYIWIFIDRRVYRS